MSLDLINQLATALTFGLIVKLFLLVAVFFFFVFTIVVYREIRLMTQILDSSISPIIKGAAIVLILAVAFAFFLTVFLI